MLWIVDLAEAPDLIPVVARWHWEEWGHGDPSGALSTWTNRLRRRVDEPDHSVTWVAVVDQRPVGSVALNDSDMTTHREWSPWLSALYVVPPSRGAGIGATLVRHCESAAQQRGVSILHLYTTTAAALYLKLGWRSLGQEQYGDENVEILTRRLGPEPVAP